MYMYITGWLAWNMDFILPSIGISPSQLTKLYMIYFRGVGVPPTSIEMFDMLGYMGICEKVGTVRK